MNKLIFLMCIFLCTQASASVSEDICYNIEYLSSDCNILREKLNKKLKKEPTSVTNNTNNTVNNYYGSKSEDVVSTFTYGDKITRPPMTKKQIKERIKEFNELNG